MATPRDIVWLASYPKSGNTWLRFLLHHYLYGEVTDSAQVARRIPDLHVAGPDGLPAPGEAPLFCKTHLTLGPRHPHVDRTAGFVYILRHPRDVMISDLNYVRMTAPDADQVTDAGYAREFIRHMGSPAWRRVGMGSWPEHVGSWLAGTPRFPHVLLRYEDMKADPGRELARVLRLVGEEPDKARVEAAVAGSRFERMRDLEARERREGTPGHVFEINERSLERGLSFMRAGKSGQSLAHLGPEVEAAFEARFGEVLRLLGL